MGFFENELQKMFGTNSPITDARFVGRACMGRLGGTTNVKLQFVTLGTYEKYEGIEATVYNRNDGKIDSNVFRFADILGKNVSRNNYNNDLPYVWTNDRKHEWYSYKPTAVDYAAVAKEVNNYLEVFLEQQRPQGKVKAEKGQYEMLHNNGNKEPLVTAAAINGEIRLEDWVISVPDYEYPCLVGMITEIKPLGSPDHDTGNETDDVYVNFADLDYSDKRVREIERQCAKLYGKHTPFDELPLDSVIMAPENLIRITGIELDKLSSLVGSYKAAEDYCNSVLAQHDTAAALNVERLRENPRTQERRNLYLLHSCNEWCEKSKASLLLVTSDKETLYIAIGGEILTGNMEYDGESGGNGFANYKWDYLNHNVEMGKLNYGFVKEMDEALLSEPDTVPKYYMDASEFLDAYFEFDAATFDKAYNSDYHEYPGEPDDENDMEI